MASRKGSADASQTRKRKAHTKSRGGCGNCKLRRVKCDEAKPSCKRCKSYGVACTYDRVATELQPFSEGAFVLSAPQLEVNPLSMSQTFLGLLNDSLRRQAVKDRAWQLTNYDLVLLNKFHDRAAMTIGTEETRYIFREQGLKLAFRHSFLMHIALSFTLMYDRARDFESKQSTAELFHLYHGVAEFNSKLSSPTLTSSEKDAIWVTAALLGCTTLAHVDGATPEEVWPLKASTVQDLDWLRMAEGKKEIWKVADVLRQDSVLQGVVVKTPRDFLDDTSDWDSIASLPREFAELCDINESTKPDSNPYYTLLSILGRLMPLQTSQTNLVRSLAFLSQMSADFRVLIEKKEPRAVLMLAWFSAKVSEQYRWWWWKRAMLEGQAMCIYLERHQGTYPHLKKLLEYPRTQCYRDLSEVGTGSLYPLKGFPAQSPPTGEVTK
ncbi:hypothetical protein GQ53DRAFT_753216 [Thozetella sp. PMI_491]|nr:hypothetical protein GQ53DRAFT_753216 [Thozetella sp. PMI_491]